MIISSELEKARENEKKEMVSLQSKYDLLEEDYVLQKAQVGLQFRKANYKGTLTKQTML